MKSSCRIFKLWLTIATIMVAIFLSLSFLNEAAIKHEIIAESDMQYKTSNINNDIEENKTMRAVPIIMYHSVLKSIQNEYIVSPTQLENDFLYFKNKGFTPVFLNDLLRFAKSECDLPSKPIVYTFDDGYYNNLLYVLPLLEKHDLRINLNINGITADKNSMGNDHTHAHYSNLTWNQISEFNSSGRIEIGNHTYDMHRQENRKGASKMRGETSEMYKNALSNDVLKNKTLLLNNCKISDNGIFAYPFGAISKNSRAILYELGYEIQLTCCESVNIIKRGDIEKMQNLYRINRSGSLKLDQILHPFEKKFNIF